jgi:prepilin-type N-terminal cleavage/methylation domain-containing protein
MQMVQTKHEKSFGFTIVELLIVIVVIGILAVITVVAYNGIQARAQAANVQGALAQVNKKLAAYMVDNSSYPADQTAFDALIPGTATTYQYTGSSSTYCVTATNGTTSYKADSTATQPAAGGCAGHGVGGSPPVVNLAKKPYPSVGDVGGWTGSNTAGGHTFAIGPGTYTGRGAWRLTSGAAGVAVGASLGYEYQGTGITVTPGDVITPSIYVQASKTGDYRLYYQFFNNTTAVGSAAYSTTSTIAPSTWTRYVASTVTVPATADRMTIRASYVSGTTWAAADWVEVTCVSTAPGAYADGDSSNWVWTGTARATKSTGPQL